MEFTTLDNWTIVKLLGGLSAIILGLLFFGGQVALKYIDKKLTHSINVQSEYLKGEIGRQNSLLSSFVSDFFDTSQKVNERRIIALERFWHGVKDSRQVIPGRVSLIYNILTNEERFSREGFEKIKANSKVCPNSQDLDFVEISSSIVKIKSQLEYDKPFISDNLYTLFLSYSGVIGRIGCKFATEFLDSKIYDWDNDPLIYTMVRRIVSDKEFSFVKSKEVGSLDILLEMMEFKILQEIRSTLKIQGSEEDAIAHLRRLESIVNTKR